MSQAPKIVPALTAEERARYDDLVEHHPIAAHQREKETQRAGAFPRLLAAYYGLDYYLMEAAGHIEELERAALSAPTATASTLGEGKIALEVARLAGELAGLYLALSVIKQETVTPTWQASMRGYYDALQNQFGERWKAMEAADGPTAAALAFAAHLAPTVAARGAVETGGWIACVDKLPESMPDEWLGLEGEDDEIKAANRQSEDVLICRTVNTSMNKPYEAVQMARFYPGMGKGEGIWFVNGSHSRVFPHSWQPLPTPPAAPTEATSHREGESTNG